MKLYTYNPLKGKAEIRVLHLSPGTYNDSLRGTLVCVDLDTDPFYVTLSYTWGEPDFICSIDIDGFKLPITTNLDLALRRVRTPHSANIIVKIWVDAICINQKNIAERNQQVSLMSRIYSGCEGCAIYLGEEQNNSALVPEFLRTLVVSYSHLWSHDGLSPGEYVLTQSHNHYESLPALNDPGWHALRCLMARPWFRRVWVIQEYALPEKIGMICGEWCIDATVIGAIIGMFKKVLFSHIVCQLDDPVQNELADRGMVNIIQHLSIRLACGNKSEILEQLFDADPTLELSLVPADRSLIFLLQAAGSCESRDPHDRFYGVFGLVTDLESLELDVDYTKDVEELDREIARKLIGQGWGADILRRTWRSDHTASRTPSWHPEWARSQRYMFRCGRRNRIDLLKHAIHRKSTSIHLKASDVLSVKGYALDVIEELGLEWSYGMPDLALEHAEAMIAKSRFLRTDQNQPDSLWRTLIGNNIPNEASPAPSEYGIKHLHLRKFMLEKTIYPLDQSQDPSNLPKGANKQLCDSEEFLLCMLQNRDTRFCITRSGMMAIVPRSAMVGDIIFTLLGDPEHATFSIRKKANEEYYTWIGQTYVHCVFGNEYYDIEAGEPSEILVC